MQLRFALRNLSRSPRRTLLLLVTVAMGVFGMFTFQGFDEGILQDYRVKTIHGQMGNGQIYRKGYRNQVLEKPSKLWIDDYAALATDLKKSPEVEHVFPRLRFAGFLTTGGVNVAGIGEGIDGPEEASFFTALNFRSGKTLEREGDGILLGEGLATSLGARVGDTVTVLANTVDGRLSGLDLKVVGIFWTGMKSFDDTVFRIQLSKAQQLLETRKVESLGLGLRDMTSWGTVQKAVEARHPELEAVPFEEMDKIYYQHSVDFLKSQFGLILAIILVIVLLGVFNTVSLSVLDRRHEIGVLRANGESRRSVLGTLMLEGLAVGVLGAVAGTGLAYLVNATLLRHGIPMPPAPGFSNEYYAFLKLDALAALPWMALGVAAAVIGTALGAWGVVRQTLGEALRR